MRLLDSTAMQKTGDLSPPGCGRAWLFPSLALLLALPLAGCEGTIGLDPEKVQVEVRAALEAYLPQLGAAYREQDPSQLNDVAVPKEIAHVELRIDELAERGERLISELEQFTIDTLKVARATAYVATTEVWDIERRALGSDRLLESYPGTTYQVRYQLHLDGGRWVVVFRQLIDPPQT